MSNDFAGSPPFPKAAPRFVADSQLRANLRTATSTIRAKRDRVVSELPDFEQLRTAAAGIKDEALGRLDQLLVELEANFTAAGGHVHFATDADEANRTVLRLVQRAGAGEVVKVKSMTTAETGLNQALADAGIDVAETDLAELIVQLGEDLPSHIVVPAIHRNRSEVREIFLRQMGQRGHPAPPGLRDEPAELAAAARAHLRDRFLRARVAVSGANFAIAETGTLVVVESEGNGRMCLTLPEVLISVVGIDKVLPRFSDLEVFLQLLARSATGERLSPYTSTWTGVTPGDGPREAHLVLLDNGRSRALADRVGRQALRCIRCAACLNVCPVYERVGGHAYGSVYPGPIGAVLVPQLHQVASDPVAAALPFASTLCGACAEVCPVRIDIPRLLVHLRARAVDRARQQGATLEGVAMAAAGFVLASPQRLGRAERWAGRLASVVFPKGKISLLPAPLSRWTAARDAPVPAAQSFRDWWQARHLGGGEATGPGSGAGRVGRGRTAGGEGLRVPGLGWAHLLGAIRARGSGGAPGPGNEPWPTGAPRAGREGVLAAVRGALRAEPSPLVPVDRSYRQAGTDGPTGSVELFLSRLADYGAGAQVVRAGEGEAEVGAAVRAALVGHGSRRAVVPGDLPDAWLPAGEDLEWRRDTAELSPSEMEELDATVTGCALAIAETGTIVLDGGPAQGRRALSLLPDHLVAVVRASQLVARVPDAFARLDARAPQTWISGPSATSDIELNRVEGVHGPRRLDVVVVTG